MSKQEFLTEIELADLENLFWHNGSREVPEKIVENKKFTKKIKVRVKWSNKVSGILTLKGMWNYAKYKDSYYFLDIVIPLDNNKEIFTYAIYRDEWAEFIKIKTNSIVGTLVKTNEASILWENLQTTSSAIANLGKTNIIPLTDKKFIDVELGVVKIVPLTDAVYNKFTHKKTLVVTKENFKRWFKEMAKVPLVYSFDGYFSSPGRASFKCMSTLYMTLMDSWQKGIFEELKKWLDENEQFLNVCLVTEAKSMGLESWINSRKESSASENIYCIESGYKTGILSKNQEENNYIDSLDLSGMTDIRMVDKVLHGQGTARKNILDFFPNEHPENLPIIKKGIQNKYLNTRASNTNQPDQLFDRTGFNLSGYTVPNSMASEFGWPGNQFDTQMFIPKQMSIWNPYFPYMPDGNEYKHENSPHRRGGSPGYKHAICENITKNMQGKPELVWQDENNKTEIYNPENAIDVWIQSGDFITSSKIDMNNPDNNRDFCGISFVTTPVYGQKDGRTDRWKTYFQDGEYSLAFVTSTTHTAEFSDTHIPTTEEPEKYAYKKVNDTFGVAPKTYQFRWYIYSQFFKNEGSGAVTNKLFKNLTAEGRVEVEAAVRAMAGDGNSGIATWWKTTRTDVSKPFPEERKPTLTVKRPWMWPRDNTDNYIYLKATSSDDESFVFLSTEDNKTMYTFEVKGILRNASNYSIQIKKAWSSLPTAKPKNPNLGRYIHWKSAEASTTDWKKNPWHWDIFGMSESNKKFFTDMSELIDENPGGHLNALDKIIYELYRRFSPHLNPTLANDGNYYIHWPAQRDYQQSCQLFDLVGTDYFLCIQKKENAGRASISLIIKNNIIVKKPSGMSLTVHDVPKITDIVAAINQNNTIFLNGHTFEINTKLIFGKNKPWTLGLNTFDLKAEGETEYYSYKFTGPNEYIQGQFNVVKTPKASAGNNLEMDRLLLERDEFNAQRQINLEAVANNNRNNRTALQAAYQDYDISRNQANNQWWTSLGLGLAGSSAMGKLGSIGSSGGGVGAAVGMGGALVGLAGTLSHLITSSMQMGSNNYKAARDLEERKIQLAKQIELTKNQADNTHKYAEIRMRRELDRVTNHRIAPDITERSVLNAYLEEMGWTKYHIIHATPSEKVMEHLKVLFDEYGADVMVNDYVFSSHIDMGDDSTRIIQFSSIYNIHIKDQILFRNLRGRMINGIKIIM